MSKDLKIEKLTEKNFEYFISLIEKLAEYEKSNPPDKEAKIRLKKDALSEKKFFEAYLGKINEKYVSCVVFFMTYSSYMAKPILYLEDIFVLDEYRKQGIGQKMFDFCVKKSKEKGCGRMEWSVLNWNEPAINFYEKNKATRLDKSYYRLNEDQINHKPDKTY